MLLEEWKIIKDALREKMMQSTDEDTDIKIAVILPKVEKEIFKLSQPKTEVFSLPECIFSYCPSQKWCKENGCQNKKRS